MRMNEQQKSAARALIIAAAGKRFRVDGLAGVGIDALAKEAGQTSGAIYAHFTSKADVFAAVVETGLERLLAGIQRASALGGLWARTFAAQYLSPAHRGAIAEGCLLPSLSADVARAGPDVRAHYAESLEAAVMALAAGCPGHTEETRRQQAMAVLAMGAGGLLLARALPDGPLALELLEACRKATDELLPIHDSPSPQN